MKRASVTPFTLIEVLIVVIILGTLAALVIPRLDGVVEDSQESTIKSNLHSVRTAIKVYKTTTGIYPTNIAHITQKKTVNNKTVEILLDAIPTNPVNNKNNVNATNAAKGTVTNSKAWNYNATTGEFWADTTGHGNF